MGSLASHKLEIMQISLVQNDNKRILSGFESLKFSIIALYPKIWSSLEFWQSHCVEKREILSHQKNISSNQLFSILFS